MSAATDSAPPPKRRARTRQAAVSTPPRKATPAKPPHRGHRWLMLIPGIAFGLLAILAVLSFDPRDDGAWNHGLGTHNWIGPVGHGLAWMLFHAVGVSAYGVAFAILTIALLACSRNGLKLAPLATFGWVLVACTTSALTHLLADPSRWSYPPGGAFGRAFADLVKGGFSFTGALILLGALMLMAILLATHFRAAHAIEFAARGVSTVSVKAARHAYAAIDRQRRARQMRSDAPDDVPEFPLDEVPEPEIADLDDEEEEEAPAPAATKPASQPAAIEPPRPPPPPPKITEPPGPITSTPPRLVLPNVPAENATTDPGPVRAAKAKALTTKREQPKPPEPAPAPTSIPPPSEGEAAVGEVTGKLPVRTMEQEILRVPAIVEPRALPKPPPIQKQGEFQMAAGKTGFHLPSTEDVLEAEVHVVRKIDRGALTATAEKLRQKLIDMGVEGEVTEIRPGPVVTMYEFKPAAGIKLSRIAALSDDLAMAMEAFRVRIVAPIPGKGVVGFEVPNRTRETVYLKDVVEQEAFQKSNSKLTMAIGKDIEGMPYVTDLAKMPHLLIAGTTGSGKSVGVNAMLTSMLMRATPEELRFIMVDPKMLELSIYEGVPHLLLPVVTDPKKAAMALRWAVEEMERRYALLAEAGVRNISSYNKHVEKELAAQAAASYPVSIKLSADEHGAVSEPPPADEDEEPKRKLPFIVIVIDELADLMMVAAKEVEVYIARLAQMARAAGIHLMVATQRPSTDVLTGVIKANFPSRISFQVASRHDSGTIINTPGAENLLGMGDMLILPPGTSSLTRVHGAYITEVEINRLTKFWKEQGAPVYDNEILRPREEDGELEEEDQIADELYDQAIAAVADMRQVSISLLQRKMRIGYNRSARMIERMERDGIVGPADGAKPREVLIRGLGQMES